MQITSIFLLKIYSKKYLQIYVVLITKKFYKKICIAILNARKNIFYNFFMKSL